MDGTNGSDAIRAGASTRASGQKGQLDRRALIKGAAVAGAAAWTAPVILDSLTSPAAADSPPPSGCSISFVRVVGTNFQASPAHTSTVITVGASGVAKDDFLVVAGRCGNGTTTGPSAIDSKGNTYTLDLDDILGSSFRLFVLSAPVTTALGSGDTITVSYQSTSTGTGVSILEFTCLTARDGTAAAPDGTLGSIANYTEHTSSATSFTVTANGSTTVANELIFAVLANGRNNAPTVTGVGTGFAIAGQVLDDQPAAYLTPQYKVVNSTGIYSASATISDGNVGVIGIVTYK